MIAAFIKKKLQFLQGRNSAVILANLAPEKRKKSITKEKENLMSVATKYNADRAISAIFSTLEQVDEVIRNLLKEGVPRDHVSVIGRNFQTETRISGFITKRDVILDGLKSGAIFGSLFGSLLSLLTGVGVLFIPFVGPVVAAGPLGAVLLGATSGAIAASAGAGLISVLTTLGMPEDKAAVYQTRLEAGEFFLVIDVPAEQVQGFEALLEQFGGEEIHTVDQALPRPCEGRCTSVEDLSPEVRSHLSKDAQKSFVERYNAILDETGDPLKAEEEAWNQVREQYDVDDSGIWSREKVLV